MQALTFGDLNSHWLEDEIVQNNCQKSIADYWHANQGITGPSTAWEASKAVLRGTFMFITGILCKNTQQHTEELQNTMMVTETAYVQNPSTAMLTPWLHSRREYELCLLDLTKKRMLYVTQKTFEHGNKAGRLLAYLTRSDRTPISIPRILTSQDKISDVPQDITGAFLSFYRNLYTTRAHYSETQLDEYLTQTALPQLSEKDRDDLDKPLSVEELSLAISQLPTIRRQAWMVFQLNGIHTFGISWPYPTQYI